MFGRRLVRSALVPPVPTNRLGRDLYPPAEIAGLDTGRLDALTVSVAAATLREATTAALPQLLDLDPVPAGGDPLELVLAARDELETVPDELDNLPLFLGRLRMHDAVAAVRTHYERTAEPETGAEPAAAGASAR